MATNVIYDGKISKLFWRISVGKFIVWKKYNNIADTVTKLSELNILALVAAVSCMMACEQWEKKNRWVYSWVALFVFMASNAFWGKFSWLMLSKRNRSLWKLFDSKNCILTTIAWKANRKSDDFDFVSAGVWCSIFVGSVDPYLTLLKWSLRILHYNWRRNSNLPQKHYTIRSSRLEQIQTSKFAHQTTRNMSLIPSQKKSV